MAGLGKIFKKLDPSVSGRDQIKYEQLSQDPHDNEEEDDDVVFSKNGVLSNGIDSIEHAHINEVQLHRAKILKKEGDVEVKVKKLKTGTKYRALCVSCFLLIIIALFLAGALLWPILYGQRADVMNYNSTADWTLLFKATMSESCVRLYDVDLDGKDDIIIGLEETDREMEAMEINRDNMQQFCDKYNENIPCLGTIKAIRGHDGKELWSIRTYGTVFAINCNIDINQDGHLDCIGTGRLSTCMAFDPLNGTVLWSEDLTVTSDGWNTYNVLILPDLTNDGVPEVLLPNGGDPQFEPEVTQRLAGRLILLDGASGQHIGRYVSMVDAQGEKETYMSPVLHQTRDHSMYILYGSGGETVPGSFNALSLPDFYRYVHKLEHTADVPATIPGTYKDFPNIPRNKDGIMALYNSTTQGVMVPPVLIDMNADDVNDILMSAYDGTMILFNGQTLEEMWTKRFPHYEMYSTPAPGFLNDDTVPDFMFHVNFGTWDEGYNYSLLVILDGSTGATLLTLNTTYYQMSSDLVVRTTDPHRDVFIARIQRDVELEDATVRRKRGLYSPSYDPNRSPSEERRWYDTDKEPFGNQRNQYDDERSKMYENQGQPYENSRDLYENQQQQTSYENSPRESYESSRGSFQNSRNPVQLPRRNSKQRYNTDTDQKPRYEYAYGDGTDAPSSHPKYRGRYPSKENKEMALDDDDAVKYYYNENGMPLERDDADFVDYGADDDKAAQTNRVFHPDPQASLKQDSVVGDRSSCKGNKKLSISTQFYAIDRTTLLKPLLLVDDPARAFHYNLSAYDDWMIEELASDEEGSKDFHDSAEATRPRRQPGEGHEEGEELIGPGGSGAEEVCSVLVTTEKTTGAIGDLDGDGDLDLVLILVQYNGDIMPKANTKVMKIDLKKALESSSETDIRPTVAPGERKSDSDIKSVRFLSKRKQPWVAYLGSNGDSKYGKS